MEISVKNFNIEKVYGIVYKIQCIKTNKCYIGQTLSHFYKNDRWKETGIYNRMIEHYKTALSKNDVTHTDLHRDMKKYGINYFKIEPVNFVPGCEINKIDSKESEMIKKYNCITPDGYNNQQKSSVLNPTKKYLIDYYKLNNKRPKEYFERQNRRQQKTIKNEDEFNKIIKEENVMNVKIVPINHNSIISEIRLIFETEQGNIYRKNFNGNLSNAIKRAKNIAYMLTEEENIQIRQVILDIENGKKGEATYKYQDKLNKMLGLKNISTISINATWHKTHEKYLALVSIYYNDGKPKNSRAMFGGKHSEPEQDFEIAREFAQKIIQQYNSNIKVNDNINKIYD